MNKTVCEECSGHGYISIPKNKIYRCRKCYGLGSFDFIEIITESFKYRATPSMHTLLRKWTLDTGLGFLEFRVRENWAFGAMYDPSKKR